MNRTKTMILLLLLMGAMVLPAFADDTAPCAFDGMLMKKGAFEATAKYKGETLYFCNAGQKAAFMKNPNHYRKSVKSGNLNIILNFMTAKEHMMAMKDMGMEMKPSKEKGNYHVSALVYDTKTKKFSKLVRVNVSLTDSKGKTVDKRLMYMPMMMHFGSDLNLSKGAYKGVVTVKYNKKDYKANFNWKN